MAAAPDTLTQHETYSINNNDSTNKKIRTKQRWLWDWIIFFIVNHILALIGIWKLITFDCMWKTFVFNVFYYIFSATSITGGSHRLWAHRSYKAKLPFRIWLMLWNCAAYQHTIYTWARDHRIHHKYVDTEADPHNSNRGFFYCHIGWLIMERDIAVEEKEKVIDASDIHSDPVVIFQKKYFNYLVPLLAFFLPTYIPYKFWGESLWTALVINIFRYILSLHGTFLINSAAHMWGNRPYDASIKPTENRFVSGIICGEGWHNYHHAFPWDYQAAELGGYPLNLTALLIDFMALIGQAYDLKRVSKEVVTRKANNRGDGSWSNKEKLETNYSHQTRIWGWGDKNMSKEDLNSATITYTIQ